MPISRKFWNKAAARYSKMPIRDPESYQAALERTRSYLSPGDHALELGCGTGGTARLLAPHLAHITATDIAPAMIDIARQRTRDEGVKNASFETADIAAAPNGPFDVVLAHNLLHLLPDLPADLGYIRERVKPGGLFISKTICLSQPGSGWKLRLIRMALPLLQLIGKAPAVLFLSIPALESMITRAGFEIVETGNYPAQPPSRYIVARRNPD